MCHLSHRLRKRLRLLSGTLGQREAGSVYVVRRLVPGLAVGGRQPREAVYGAFCTRLGSWVGRLGECCASWGCAAETEVNSPSCLWVGREV